MLLHAYAHCHKSVRYFYYFKGKQRTAFVAKEHTSDISSAAWLLATVLYKVEATITGTQRKVRIRKVYTSDRNPFQNLGFQGTGSEILLQI
jgi:hypothetical protein